MKRNGSKMKNIYYLCTILGEFRKGNMKKTVSGVSESDKRLLMELLPKETRFPVLPETIEKLLELGNTVTLEKGTR